MTRDRVDRWLEEMPEAKIQLVSGQLVMGNGGSANLHVLRQLLEGWGTEAAVPFASCDLWLIALAQAFAQFEPPALSKPLESWQSWAAQLAYRRDLPPAGPMIDGKHRAIRQRLHRDAFALGQDSGFAQVAGPDVIMRLGEDALTPDVFLMGPDSARSLNKHYLDGPAELAIEVLVRGRVEQDCVLKRHLYQASGVTEYWIIDPHEQAVEFLVLGKGRYAPRQRDATGTYRPLAFPGLCLAIDSLWQQGSWGDGPTLLTVDRDMPKIKKRYAKGGVSWGDLPFEPEPDLAPLPLSFEQFASWAPEAKFEMIDGKPWIGGSRGSRNVLGMLLRTLGLLEAVSVRHPKEWIRALAGARLADVDDKQQREHWWRIAHEAAALLRDRYGEMHLVVIGDLVERKPLSLWSAITLVLLDDQVDDWRASELLFNRFRDEPDIHLVKAKHATGSEKDAIKCTGQPI